MSTLRTLTTWLIAAASMTVAATAFAAAASGSGRSPHCAPTTKTARTLSNYIQTYFAGVELIACWRPSGKKVSVGTVGGDPNLFDLVHRRVAGRFIALEDREVTRDGSRFLVRVFDVRRGRRVRSYPTGPLADRGDPDGVNSEVDDGAGFTTTIKLLSDGTVAWITEDLYSKPSMYQVWLADRTGPRRLDRSTEINPLSLRLSTSCLVWRADGLARRARVRPTLRR